MFLILLSSFVLVLTVIFHYQLGSVQIIKVVSMLSVCVGLCWFLYWLSNRISLHAEIRTFPRTTKRTKLKKIWKYRYVFCIKLSLCVFFTIALAYPLTYIFTVIHEFSHAITGVAIGAQIESITISGPREGQTDFSVTTSNLGLSLLTIAGSMGEVLVGSALLILIYRNKGIQLDVFIPTYCIISFNIVYNLLYWWSSVQIRKGDGWDFLTYNPQIPPLLLIAFSIVILLVLVIYLTIYFMHKIMPRIIFFKDNHDRKRSVMNAD